MFASGVCGDTTAVWSDMVSFEEAAETVTRFWLRRQRLGSATIINATLTNVLKFVGAWMTDGGASSESARVRTGNCVSRRDGCGASELGVFLRV